MLQFSDLCETLAQYLTPGEVANIGSAFELATRAHQGQFRFTGEPYISHPLEVARILATLRMDSESIIAALLHDTIEDTTIDKSAIAAQFGQEVAELVDGVSKLTQINFETKAEQQAENFRKMMLAMAKDIRVIMVKLADRLHNMRTLFSLPQEKRRRIAKETLEIYAPIASRLGINGMRVELEDLGFHALYPMRYRILKEAVRRSRGNRKEILNIIENKLNIAVEQQNITGARVWGREKHLFSLYRKMRDKGLSFSEVMDVYAFRLIVEDTAACYRVLGIAHSLYKPVLGRFKDYIAIPKANGYQSLHTTLLGPYGVPIELQIRTEIMDRTAENGIAAHWLYKVEGNKLETERHTKDWLKNLLEIQENAGNSLEFIENVKIDLYPDEVYVFTPKGKILALPEGATPIDFAYAVHTDIGNHCVAAKVDRRLTPLSAQLQSGQTIDIITTPNANPHPAWLSFAITGKARSNIRGWLKGQQKSESRALGRRLVEKALQSVGGNLDLLNTANFETLLKQLMLPNIDVLFEEVGLGKLAPITVAEKLLGTVGSEHALDAETLSIRGTEGLIVSYATCCYPIPGDPIVGYTEPGQGLWVHTDSCKRLTDLRHHSDRFVYVRWDEQVKGNFLVEIKVDVLNVRGALATMAGAISEANADIVNVRVDERDGRHNTVRFVMSVRDRGHLARIMRRMRALDVVTRISRA